MQEEEVVYFKVLDKYTRDVVLFEGKVSTEVEPCALMKLGCFLERRIYAIYIKATKEQVKSFKGLQNNVELVAGGGVNEDFSGVLYVGAEDGVLRKSHSVPSCECVMMSVWYLSQEECEKAFKCETLEVLEMHVCKLGQIPREIGKMKKLKKLRLEGWDDLKSIPEEIGELSNLEELWIGTYGIKSLPKRLKELKMMRRISLWGLNELQLHKDDLVVFSRLKHLTIQWCDNVFTPPLEDAFWEVIKSTTDVRVLELSWTKHKNQKMSVAAALEANGSIVDGGEGSGSFDHIFERNKENHERALQCVLRLLAIRRWRNEWNHVPKEMVKMIAMMLRNTKCDVDAWSKK